MEHRKERSERISSFTLGMNVTSIETDIPADILPWRSYLISKKFVIFSFKSSILKLPPSEAKQSKTKRSEVLCVCWFSIWFWI